MVPDGNGGWVASRTSPASRVLRYPNALEEWPNFSFNVTADILFEGESLVLIARDDRYAVNALWRIPRRSWTIHVDSETKEVFYGINDADHFSAPKMLVPKRDVIHFRQHTPRHPLIGESPVKAAALASGIHAALSESQLFFFRQMQRPSGVLSTDMSLTSEQMRQLRISFSEQSKLFATGGMPILASGLKFQSLNVAQGDAQLVEQQRMSLVDIARIMGVPMVLLSEGSGPQGGTEAMISHWLSIGLGSVIETIERSLDRAFGLPADEHIELDPAPLLRVDFAGRIDGYVKAVQGGIMSPAEIRSKEGLGNKEGADELYMQRQMTSLAVLTDLAQAELDAKKRDANPPVAVSAPDTFNQDDAMKTIAGIADQIHVLSERMSFQERPSIDPDIVAMITADAIRKALN